MMPRNCIKKKRPSAKPIPKAVYKARPTFRLDGDDVDLVRRPLVDLRCDVDLGDVGPGHVVDDVGLLVAVEDLCPLPPPAAGN